MMGAEMSLVLLIALICALVAGYSAWKCFERWRRKTRHRESVQKAIVDDATSFDPEGISTLDTWVITYAERESRAISYGHGRKLIPEKMASVRGFSEKMEKAGLADKVTEYGFCEARLKLSIAGALAGLIVGLMLSAELGLLLMFLGGVFGWRLLGASVKRRIAWRSSEMERHLPEMLDVVAIGMRSGLSFDRSLDIYSARFPTLMAREFAHAKRKWVSGLERRDEALRKLAATYDSVVLSRVVESIIRSLRFGSSMVEGLEAAARDARTAYRVRRQEQVAKAPVKMMVPTGTLILPAMLILVLGPVLLELIGGGI